jgi:hypothetical protein
MMKKSTERETFMLSQNEKWVAMGGKVSVFLDKWGYSELDAGGSKSFRNKVASLGPLLSNQKLSVFLTPAFHPVNPRF